MTKKHIYALILPAMLVLSVYTPTKGHCADNNKKQLAVLSEPASSAQNANGVHPHPVIHVKNQLNAMSQHVSDTTTDSINQYLSSLSPAVKAAGGYFHNAIKQYGAWIHHFGKQTTSFAPDVKVTPAAGRF